MKGTILNLLIKRVFDIVVSFLGLMVLCIPSIVIAVVIKVTSDGPVFYRQKRIGRFGRPFMIVKFRTMFLDSEKEGSITTSKDRRITFIGRILRILKFDEIPQLWNILSGAMSFVGPRPDVAGYADKLMGNDRVILELRPGITGPATLYFRNEEKLLADVNNPREYNDTLIWPKKVAINRDYYLQWSFWKDIGYILITLVPPLNRLFNLVEESTKQR